MAFQKNVGSIDKTIRLIVGLLLVAFSIFGAGLSTTLGLVALVIGLVLSVTGVVNFCPLFKVLGISSIKSR